LKSGKNIWIDSLVHDPDLLEYLCKKIGSDRIVVGSDYPFPLGEVPMAGKMLATHERLAEFLTWEERGQMLAGNTINLLSLGLTFQKKYRRRLAAVIGHVSTDS